MPGAGYLDGARVQVARCGPVDDAAAAEPDPATAARIAACVAAYRSRSLDDADALAVTPDFPRFGGLIGVADITGAPVTFDLTSSDLLVTGPPKSGRSTALANIASQLQDAGHDTFVIGAEDSGMRTASWLRAAWSTSDTESLLGELRAHLAFPGANAVLVVDDLDLVEGGAFESGVSGYEHNRALRIVASTTAFPYPANDVRKRLRLARQLLYLQPGSSREVAEIVGVLRLPPLRPGLSFPPGRGLFMANRVPTTVQSADPDRPDEKSTRSTGDG